ncbi:MAG TPA: hypothetical protein VK640_12245 [Actinomycetes bacterium]|nr:hypothetical protein [Actinomycetes bacterium]
MRRRTLDILLTTGGLVLAAILLVAGGLLVWANTFIEDQVTTQLSQQNVFFPPKGEATADPKIGPYINQYAEQQLVNGEQAKAYADHFIAVHLEESTGGKTYSELSTISRENPDDAEAAALVQTAFRGETLRGLLLNAYAFWKMAQIAMYAAIAAFVGAGLMLLLSIAGFVHLRRVDPTEEAFTAHTDKAPALA